MKLNETALAKAHALLGFAAYILCVISVAVFPEATKWIFDAWIHGLDISGLPTQLGPVSLVVVGIITFTAAAYVWGYFLARFYNKFLGTK